MLLCDTCVIQFSVFFFSLNCEKSIKSSIFDDETALHFPTLIPTTATGHGNQVWHEEMLSLCL